MIQLEAPIWNEIAKRSECNNPLMQRLCVMDNSTLKKVCVHYGKIMESINYHYNVVDAYLYALPLLYASYAIDAYRNHLENPLIFQIQKTFRNRGTTSIAMKRVFGLSDEERNEVSCALIYHPNNPMTEIWKDVLEIPSIEYYANMNWDKDLTNVWEVHE